jgi:hypothetical protein
MSQSNESFKRDLDELMRLFKKIREKSGDERFDQIDPMLKQHLDFVISNYDSVKDNMQIEILSNMGFPVQQMLRQFIQMMKMDLGEDLISDNVQDEQQPTAVAETPSENDDDIKKIDQLLKNPNLTEAQINNLLDRRNQVLSKDSKNILQ